MGSVSIIGFVVWLGGMSITVTLLSDCVSHNSLVSAFCTSKVVDRIACDPLTKATWKGVRVLNVWHDCGSHFRSGLYSAFCLFTLPFQEKKVVRKRNFEVNRKN